MARQYSPKTFLRQTPNTVLQQYFHENNLSLDVDWKCRRLDKDGEVVVPMRQRRTFR